MNQKPVNRHALAMILALTLLACALPSCARAAEFRVERVFGPETPTGKYKHPAAMDELANGDLYLVWYGGEGEYANATAIWGTRRKKGETIWSMPVKIASNPLRSLGNAVVWQAPGGDVWLFYVTRFGETWSTSRIKAKVSKDGARTWSDSVLLTLEEGTMVRGRPIVLGKWKDGKRVGDGDWLLPIYHEKGHDTEFVTADTTSLFLRWEVDKKRWRETGRIRSRIGNLQPAVVELGENHLLAFCRRAGGYDGSEKGYVVRAESRDGGWTWSKGVDSEFPNPNAAVDMTRLRSGNLLLIYNDSFTDRTPLTAAISTDGGTTFPHRVNIREGKGPYAYPYVFQGRDGKIHLIFTSDGRTVVNHCLFEEQDVLR